MCGKKLPCISTNILKNFFFFYPSHLHLHGIVTQDEQGHTLSSWAKELFFIKADQMEFIDTDRKVGSVHLTSGKWSWDPGCLYVDEQLQKSVYKFIITLIFLPQCCLWPRSFIYCLFYDSGELFLPVSDFELECMLIQSEIQENFGVYNKGVGLVFWNLKKKHGVKTRREAPQKTHKRHQGKFLTRLKVHIIKKLNKWFTRAIRQKSEGKLRLRFCKDSNKLLNYSWSCFYSCLSGILSGTL